MCTYLYYYMFRIRFWYGLYVLYVIDTRSWRLQMVTTSRKQHKINDVHFRRRSILKISTDACINGVDLHSNFLPWQWSSQKHVTQLLLVLRHFLLWELSVRPPRRNICSWVATYTVIASYWWKVITAAYFWSGFGLPLFLVLLAVVSLMHEVCVMWIIFACTLYILVHAC